MSFSLRKASVLIIFKFFVLKYVKIITKRFKQLNQLKTNIFIFIVLNK